MARFTELQRKVRSFMANEAQVLLALPFDHEDRNATRLAENAAAEFDTSDTWLDDETHGVWEFALDFWTEDEALSDLSFTHALLGLIDSIPSGFGRRLWRVLTIISTLALTAVFISKVELNGFDELVLLAFFSAVICGAASVAISYVLTNKLW